MITHYCVGDKIQNKMGGACSAVGEKRGVYRVLVGKPERKIFINVLFILLCYIKD
jgi:hypothetical protein